VICLQALKLFEDLDGTYAAVPASLGSRSQCDPVTVQTLAETGSDDADLEPVLQVAFVWFAASEVYDFLDHATDGVTLYDFLMDTDLWPDTEATLAITPVDFLPAHGAEEPIDGAPVTPTLPVADAAFVAAAAAVPLPDVSTDPPAGAAPAPGTDPVPSTAPGLGAASAGPAAADPPRR